jgi:hypothetical protein
MIPDTSEPSISTEIEANFAQDLDDAGLDDYNLAL